MMKLFVGGLFLALLWSTPGHLIQQGLNSTSSTLNHRQDSSCENTAASRQCWGDYNIDTDYYNVTPDTGETREYWLQAQNISLAPDGYERQVLVFNGSFPGPTIEANWGDNLVIHVTNKMEDNGTAIHWHGVRQLGSNEFDGVPGVTQCPIAPNETLTYRFRATQYGTSWYHSHLSLQLADGLQGPIVIHGPATADYDEDLGTLFLTDWSHASAFKVWDTLSKYGGQPVLENGLINGTNTYDCTGSTDPACLGTGRRFEATFVSGTKYLIRLVSTQVDGYFKFTIDNHNFTVIANDFVPIIPYETNNVIMASGQRYDIVVEANQEVGSYWLRAIYQTACNNNDNDNKDNILGIVHYDGADTTQDPTTAKSATITNSCGDEEYGNLVPHFSRDVGLSASEQSLDIMWYYQLNLIFHWTVNTTPLIINWEEPTNMKIYANESVFPTDYNVYEVSEINQWTYWIIQDLTLVDAYHPMHLHGHDFFILAQGEDIFDPLFVSLNLVNPPRRDTASLLGNGYLVIAVYTDNPGSWLLHCHIAWHASQGLALQFVERESEIADLIVDYEELNSSCLAWDAFYSSARFSQDDSGI